MRKKLSLLIFISICINVFGQSFELMPGVKRVFIDAQYLKFLDHQSKFSLFSRARATTEYDETNTDLFTGSYLNYTTRSGFGASIIGRISSNNSGVDVGVHFFKATKNVMVYALPSININADLLYSWFSIVRFTPKLPNEWKLYTSIELFSAFGDLGHLSSVQRIRIGLDKAGYQFGVGVNLAESRFSENDVNPGIFIRKQF